MFFCITYLPIEVLERWSGGGYEKEQGFGARQTLCLIPPDGILGKTLSFAELPCFKTSLRSFGMGGDVYEISSA